MRRMALCRPRAQAEGEGISKLTYRSAKPDCIS